MKMVNIGRDEKGRFMKNNTLNKGRKRPDIILRNKSENVPRNTGRTRFKKGYQFWLGKKRSEESKLKMSMAKIGKKLSEEHILKLKSVAKKGIDNPSWKGGITKKTMIIRNSEEYVRWRNDVFERDNYTCKECSKKNTRLNSHHLTPFSELIGTDKENFIFDVNNGITLCLNCHQSKHPNLNFKISRGVMI